MPLLVYNQQTTDRGTLLGFALLLALLTLTRFTAFRLPKLA